MKNLFATRVFWGALFGLIAAVTPAAVDLAEGRGKTSDHWRTIFLAVAAAGLSVTGRVGAASGAYTPNWMPGPNAPEPELPGDGYQIEPREY